VGSNESRAPEVREVSAELTRQGLRALTAIAFGWASSPAAPFVSEGASWCHGMMWISSTAFKVPTGPRGTRNPAGETSTVPAAHPIGSERSRDEETLDGSTTSVFRALRNSSDGHPTAQGSVALLRCRFSLRLVVLAVSAEPGDSVANS
jgi:hypothetical protein